LVKRFQASGHTAQAVMRATGIGRASVRKWWRLSELPPRKRMAPRPGRPTFYHDYVIRNGIPEVASLAQAGGSD
jgi:hypothetical protein